MAELAVFDKYQRHLLPNINGTRPGKMATLHFKV
jgi:hypothetical protein